jgi:thioredoxin-related protein
MKFLSILFLLVFNLFSAEVIDVSQKPKADLEAIAKYAIKFGEGKNSDIYVFIDPLCKYSRELIKKIESNKMLQLTNTYHILLYRLPRLDSQKTMEYILEAKDPKEKLISVMIDEDIVDLSSFEAKEETKKIVEEISKVAQTLDMTQRPYMISFEKDSKYCRVSEGSASCLEELE